MIIPAERQKLIEAAKSFAMAVLMGWASAGQHGVGAVIGQVLVLVFCAMSAIDLAIVTDPIWRVARRAEWATEQFKAALDEIRSCMQDSTRETESLAEAFRRLRAVLVMRGQISGQR